VPCWLRWTQLVRVFDFQARFVAHCACIGSDKRLTRMVAEDGAKFHLPTADNYHYFVVELQSAVAYNVVCDVESKGFFAARLSGLPEGNGCQDAVSTCQ
jgi:hypothetical protein